MIQKLRGLRARTALLLSLVLLPLLTFNSRNARNAGVDAFSLSAGRTGYSNPTRGGRDRSASSRELWQSMDGFVEGAERTERQRRGSHVPSSSSSSSSMARFNSRFDGENDGLDAAPSDTGKCQTRRIALANVASMAIVLALVTSLPASAEEENEESRINNVFTVVIDSPDSASLAGIQFVDKTLVGSGKEIPIAESVQPDGAAYAAGVRQGMVLLGRNSASKSSSRNVDFRMRNGPYPFVLQFVSQEEAEEVMKQGMGGGSVTKENGMILGPYDQIVVKTVQKTPAGSISEAAKRGDTVVISYEARITSRDGPMYDSTQWRGGNPVKFALGKGVSLPGVDIGMNGMRVGEIREIDIPTTLGYGKFGSQVFDVPGDVRLWWRVELIELVKDKSGRTSWYYK